MIFAECAEQMTWPDVIFGIFAFGTILAGFIAYLKWGRRG